jgi:hypothetical protein
MGMFIKKVFITMEFKINLVIFNSISLFILLLKLLQIINFNFNLCSLSINFIYLTIFINCRYSFLLDLELLISLEVLLCLPFLAFIIVVNTFGFQLNQIRYIQIISILHNRIINLITLIIIVVKIVDFKN